MKAIRKGLYDPCFFAEYWLGIKLNPFQERALLMLKDALWGGEYKMEDLIEMILDAGNRTGKTVLIAIIHIYFAYYKIGITFGDGYENFKYRTFDLSPVSRQAKECLKYIEDILTGRLTWQVDGKRMSNQSTLKLRDFYEGKNENLGELRYSNRSITYAFSTGEDMGASIQGQPAGLITYDECVLSHHLEDELESNIYSRLGDYGKLMMLVATPNEEAKSQQYYYHLVSQAKAGENNYLLVNGSYLENIFIAEEKRKSHAEMLMGKDKVMARQILYGEFVTTGGSMFDTQTIERIWNGKKAPQGFKSPELDHEYVIPIDWGVADKGDETVMYVIDLSVRPFEIVYAYSKTGGDPYELMATARNLCLDYNDATIIMDTTAMGGKMFKKMMKDLKPIEFDSAGAGNLKTDALMFTQLLLTKNRDKRILADGRIEEGYPEFGWLRAPYLSKLATQAATYNINDSKLKQDWVSALWIGCWYLWKHYGDQVKVQRSFRMNRFKVNLAAINKPINHI